MYQIGESGHSLINRVENYRYVKTNSSSDEVLHFYRLLLCYCECTAQRLAYFTVTQRIHIMINGAMCSDATVALVSRSN